MIYVIDRDQMGKFHADADAVVQTIKMRGGGYGAIAYWNGHAYFAASDDYLNDYAIQNGLLKLNNSSGRKFENPGATPSVSADGNKNAIVWVIATKTWNGPDNKPAVLYAYDAKDLRQPILYFRTEQPTRSRRSGHALRDSCGRQRPRILQRKRRSRGLRALAIATGKP